MRLSRGHFALATLGTLTLLIYSCSGSKNSSNNNGNNATSTTATATTGTTGMGTTGVGGATTTQGAGGTTTSSTSAGGTTTSTSAGGTTTSTSAGGASAGGATSSTTGGAGEGGAGPGCDDPPGEVLYTFDEPGSLGDWTIRATDGNEAGLADSFLMRSATEGVSCPGSLVLTIPFSVYGAYESAEAQANFTADWTGYTTLHAWVKVQQPAGGSIAYLNGLQLFANSASYSMYSGQFVSAADFGDFDWHELTLDISEGTDLTDVDQVGVQLLVQETQENAGGDTAPTPETTVVYIDDIYLD